jgi:RHS repeat-associated protein
MGWAASPTRKQESGFSVPIIQMGARVYISSLGRFLSVDPIEGGTLNPYVYAHDPVNMDDYSGLFSLPSMLTSVGRAFNNIVRSAAKTIAKMQSKSLIKASVTTANLVAIKKISSQNSNPLSTGIYGQPIHPFFQSLNPNYYFKLSPGRPPASPQSVAAFDGCAMGVGVATILTIATAGGAVIAFGGAAAACAQGAATSVIVQSLDTSNEEKNQINSKWQAVELIFEGLNVYDKVR